MDEFATKQYRRILLLGQDSSTIEHVRKVLTGSTDTNETLDEPVHKITTPYYSASVPIWTNDVSSPSEWAAQWLAEDEAASVVRAIGAWIICFTKPTNEREKEYVKSLLSSASDVISHHLNSDKSTYARDAIDESDIVNLAVAVPASSVASADPTASVTTQGDLNAELEDLCQSAGGWEYIDGTVAAGSGQRNEFGETVGVDRLLEALKGGEWDAGDYFNLDEDDGQPSFGEDSENSGEESDEFADFNYAEIDDPGSFLKPTDMAKRYSEAEGVGLSNESAQNTYEQSQERKKPMDGTTNEMKDALLKNAQALSGTVDDANAIQEQTPQQRAGGLSSSDDGPADTTVDDDDPWRIRGKGRASQSEMRSLQKTRGEDADDGDDDDIELLQGMMLKLQAARDLGADLPAAQRRKLAAKAVKEVMRDI